LDQARSKRRLVARARLAKKSQNFDIREEAMMLISLVKDETGLELSEYAVAAALIALAVVGVFTVLGNAITTRISELGSHIALSN
jgi:Flp pilus assembly pilin Flp